MSKIKQLGGLKLLFYVPFTISYVALAAIMVLIAARTPRGLIDWPNPLVIVALILPVIFWIARRKNPKTSPAFLYIWGLVGGLVAIIGYIALKYGYLQVGISTLAFGLMSLLGSILASKNKI